jgi:hypothetical protein
MDRLTDQLSGGAALTLAEQAAAYRRVRFERRVRPPPFTNRPR